MRAPLFRMTQDHPVLFQLFPDRMQKYPYPEYRPDGGCKKGTAPRWSEPGGGWEKRLIY